MICIKKLNETLLLFNIDIIKSGQIAGLCSDLNISMKLIHKNESSKTIAELSGNPVFSSARASHKYSGTDFPSGEMIVFCNLLPDKLDKFLEEYKKRNIAPVNLKAVMTPYNSGWTPMMLYKELIKEHSSLTDQSSD